MSAASLFMATARMARPNWVRWRMYQRAQNATSAMAQATMRVQVMRIAPTWTPSKANCVDTIFGVDVNRYWQPYRRTIEIPIVIRMLRSKSFSRSRTRKPS